MTTLSSRSSVLSVLRAPLLASLLFALNGCAGDSTGSETVGPYDDEEESSLGMTTQQMVKADPGDGDKPLGGGTSGGAAPAKPAPYGGVGVVRQRLGDDNHPFKYSKQTQINGDAGFLMSTDVTLSLNGRLDWTTTVASTYCCSGFTGGQFIVISDANDNILWSSTPEQYGHGGTFVNGGPRLIPNTATVPPDVMASAKKIGVTHYHDPKNRLIPALTAGLKLVADVIPVLVALFG